MSAVMKWAAKQKGFTIVELLIVVVVIAILAAITVVAYNGITQRARNSVAQNALSQAQKKLATYAVDNSELYPTNLAQAGLVSDGNVTYQFTPNNTTTPAGYCVTVTVGGVSYRLGKNFEYTSGSTQTINDASSQSGACPGHSASGAVAITNYIFNPSTEVSKQGYGQPNSSTVERSTVRAHHGSASALVTMPQNSGSGVVGASFFQENPYVTLKPNTTYVFSAYVYVPAGTVDVRAAIQGAGATGVANNAESNASAKDQWVRVWNRFTTQPTSGNVTMYVLNRYPTPTAGTQFWVDEIMVHEGTTPLNYADGNSPNWVWSGTPGLSQSYGPAL